MAGTSSSYVNFTVNQFLRRANKLSVLQTFERRSGNDTPECAPKFPKHYKRHHREVTPLADLLEIFTKTLTKTSIKKKLLTMPRKCYVYLVLTKL